MSNISLFSSRVYVNNKNNNNNIFPDNILSGD